MKVKNSRLSALAVEAKKYASSTITNLGLTSRGDFNARMVDASGARGDYFLFRCLPGRTWFGDELVKQHHF
jgi:hypothetical protein